MRDIRVRILLLHNPEAGSEEYGKKALVSALIEAGHEPVYQSSKSKGVKKALRKKIDLALVAGGDGTVGKIARRLIGRDLPMSVLPLGTANNLARTLGFDASVYTLISQLRKGASVGFDTGRARGPWGKRRFFESMGAGLFADYLREPRTHEREAASKEEEMKRHVRALQRRLEDQPVRDWEIELDGVDRSGGYLLWEAMNIRSLGPILTLARQARSDDGRLHFVAAREEDRGPLLDYLEARLTSKRSTAPLPLHSFKKMRVRRARAALHFDDKVWPEEDEKWPSPSELRITAEPAALRIWKTKRGRQGSGA